MIAIPKTTEGLKDLIYSKTVYEWNKDGEREIRGKFYLKIDDLYIVDKLGNGFEHMKPDTYEVKPWTNPKPNKSIKSTNIFEPKDYQKDSFDFILDKFKRPGTNRVLLNLATGKGKSYISSEIASMLKTNLTVMILPRYIEQWINDIMKYLEVSRDEIFVAQERKELIKLMLLKDEDRPKVIIISLSTLNASLRENTEPLPIPISELMKHLDSEYLIVDEVHQSFVQVSNCTTILNPKNTLCLSATYGSESRNMQTHFDEFVPKGFRYNPLPPEKYRDIINYSYNIKNVEKIKFVNYFTKAYSHATFEANLVRNPGISHRYIRVIITAIIKYHISKPKESRGKLLIFASTIGFIEVMVEYLKIILGDEFDIRKYTSADSKSEILESDICVTTLGSAGTAIDIPGLGTIINTVSLSSTIANKQCFGRLRFNPDLDLRMVNIYTPSIRQQMVYVKKRLYELVDDIKTNTSAHSNIKIC